ncbi:MAG: YihY/virulence factor BrkB family protein [Chloroflexota bacterium]
MSFRKLSPVRIGREWFDAVVHDSLTGLAAELAYWFFLSMFPFFIFLTALGGAAAATFNVDDPTQRIADLLGAYMPPDATRLVEPEIQRVIGRQPPGTLSLGLFFSLWVATSGANAIIRSMNRAYSVPESRPIWQRYLLALGLTILYASVLILSFVVFVGAQVFGRQIAAELNVQGALRPLVGVATWLLVVVLLFPGSAFLYWVAPNIHLRAVWVLPGATFFTAGWLVATYLFTVYVAHFGAYGATYGTLGGVAVLLVWFYMTGFILLAGAELNAVIDRHVDPEAVEAERQRSGGRRSDGHARRQAASAQHA